MLAGLLILSIPSFRIRLLCRLRPRSAPCEIILLRPVLHRAGRAVAPRPPTFRKTDVPAGPFFADAFGLSFVTVHDGILKQGVKSLDRLYRIVSLRHRHRLYSTISTPTNGGPSIIP